MKTKRQGREKERGEREKERGERRKVGKERNDDNTYHNKLIQFL